MKSVKGPLSLPIERDLNFESKTLQELRDDHRSDREKWIKYPKRYSVLYVLFIG